MAAPAAAPLTDDDLATARAELTAGRPVRVWFTAAAVGVAEGSSAALVAVEDLGDGDFLRVRPAGSRDTVYCSPGELTRSRPARGRTAQKAPDPAPPRASAGRKAPAARSAPVPAGTPMAVVEPATAVAPSKPASARPARTRTAAPAGVTVTLRATPDGEWSVEVLVGTKPAVRATAVQPAVVAAAARVLPPPVAEAIEASLAAARARQRDRVEQLRAELDAAQRALAELGGDT